MRRVKMKSKRVFTDWTDLPDDTVIQLFSCLNFRDRASLSSTCRAYKALGYSNCLWNSLDIRFLKFDAAVADSLASRCLDLKRIRFRGAEAAGAIMHLQARDLREISGDHCRDISDATLSILVARHATLESIQLGPDFCDKISSEAIRAIALCCPNLRKLRLSGLRHLDGKAINALAKQCTQLEEIAFTDCMTVDVFALENVASLRFLSVAGTKNINWFSASINWSKLPNLVGLDVSRTSINSSAVLKLMSSSQSLKVVCALNCPVLEADRKGIEASNIKDKMLITFFKDAFKEVASLFPDNTKERDVFVEWRNAEVSDKSVNTIMVWLEWILSYSLLRVAECNPQGFTDFWLGQGATLLLDLAKSSQEEIQERAATGLATFVVVDDDHATVDCKRAESVMRGGGIRVLLDLAQSFREGLQAEAAKAIANLSVNADVAKSVADEGGIGVLTELAKSTNKLVAEEAAGGLWNLSVGEEHKGAIARAGGIKALVSLIFKWSSGCDGVHERAAGALANLAADDKCSAEVAVAGGVRALVALARTCKCEGVQEQAARALANLAAHGESNGNNAAIGREPGALETLVNLTRSPCEGVRQEAAGAIWNLSFDDRNREAIAAVGGVETLISLAQGCSNASPGLQERAAGALWGLSVTEANSIAIGQGGGVPPLIVLANSDSEDVHETAAGALWNLAFNAGNAYRIVEEGGVHSLVRLCSSSLSKMARFMSALALAYIFDGRMDKAVQLDPFTDGVLKSVSLENARKIAMRQIEEFVRSFCDPQAFCGASASSSSTSLMAVAEAARIHEAGHLRCSDSEIGRFVTMLRNPCSTLKKCAAFALLQFTIPGGRHAMYHANLMKLSGAPRVLRAAAAATTAPIEAKVLARAVLRNLEHDFSEEVADVKVRIKHPSA